MPRLTRRTVLRLGAGIAGACALDPVLQLGLATAAGAPPPDQPSPPSARALPTYLTGSFTSVARGGVETGWAIARPPGQAGPLRPVIALHGRDMSASDVMGMGVEAGLAQLVKAGYPPFAVVGVDGGNGWWHRRVSGEDPGAMVLTELLPMLATKGLDTSRVGFIGWSMGGYGALLLGGALGPARTAAICAVSPALYTDYAEAVGPARSTARPTGSRTRCTERPRSRRSRCGSTAAPATGYYLATKQFVASLRRPPAGVSFAGGHDVSAWREKLPRQLAWLAT